MVFIRFYMVFIRFRRVLRPPGAAQTRKNLGLGFRARSRSKTSPDQTIMRWCIIEPGRVLKHGSSLNINPYQNLRSHLGSSCFLLLLESVFGWLVVRRPRPFFGGQHGRQVEATVLPTVRRRAVHWWARRRPETGFSPVQLPRPR